MVRLQIPFLRRNRTCLELTSMEEVSFNDVTDSRCSCEKFSASGLPVIGCAGVGGWGPLPLVSFLQKLGLHSLVHALGTHRP